jgi:hypothetical protein
MSETNDLQFVDTNILIYAHDRRGCPFQEQRVALFCSSV